MRISLFTFVFVLTGLIMAAPLSVAHAAGDAEHAPELEWSYDGVFGTYDRAALQRGFKVYREVCAACHSMNRVYYRNLSDLGYSDAQIKAIAAEYSVTDGPNDEGEMFERPGKPSDRFVAPYANKQAATYANGAYPPDFSLIAKARHNGPDYVAALMVGYQDGHGHEALEGKYWNKYFPGHVISMAPPLMEGQVAYPDGTEETVAQYGKDVAHFLAWASEPKLEARKRTGIKVFLFLLVFAGIMYAVKKKIWANVH